MSSWSSAPPIDHATALELVAASATVDDKIAADNDVDSAKYARQDGSGNLLVGESTQEFSLEPRVSLPYPVPFLRPKTPATALAFDIMPSVGAPVVAGQGFCWFDVCDADTESTTDVHAARFGIWDDHIEIGSRRFGGSARAVKPVWITVDGMKVLSINADLSASLYQTINGLFNGFTIENASAGANAYAQSTLKAGLTTACLRAYSQGYSYDSSNFASSAQLSGFGAGGLFITAANATGSVSVLTGSATTLTASRTAQFDPNGNVFLGRQAAALAVGATDGFIHVRSVAGTPTGVPTLKTGLVPLAVDAAGSKLWAYFGGSWKSAAFA